MGSAGVDHAVAGGGHGGQPLVTDGLFARLTATVGTGIELLERPLDVVELRGVDHMLQRIPAKARMPYLAVTRFLPDWKDSWLLVARKKKGWEPRRSLSQQELSRVLPDLHW